MLSVETIAMICHEANRAYRQSIGDYSYPKWCELDETTKIGLTEAVTNILNKNAIISDDSIQLCLENGIVNSLANFVELESTNVSTTI